MSSPKPAKGGSAKAAAGTKVPRGFAKRASDAGMTSADKVNFIKAMMEGVQPKTDAKAGAKAAAKSPAKAKSKSAPVEAPKKVEILRKISAPARVVVASNPESDQALKLAAVLKRKIAAGELDALTPEAVQAMLTAICKIYAANADAGNKYPVVAGRMAISGTEAMILCGALLKAVDLQVFELGMWQSWSGI